MSKTADSSKGMYICPFPFGKSPGGNLANLRFTLGNIADIMPDQRYIRNADITPNREDIRSTADIPKLYAIDFGVSKCEIESFIDYI